MDMTVVAIGEVVVAVLKEAGYMQSTIVQYRKYIRWLGVLAAEQGGILVGETVSWWARRHSLRVLLRPKGGRR